MSSKPDGRKAGRSGVRARAQQKPARDAATANPDRPTPHQMQERLDTFIEWLARTGSVTAAAEQADLNRTLLYERRRTHQRFAAAWNKALSLGVDSLHDKAMHRAMEGDERPIVRKGELVATERRYDNRLLQFLLKAHKPEFAGATPVASDSEQQAMARRLKAAAKRLAAHRARQAGKTEGDS